MTTPIQRQNPRATTVPAAATSTAPCSLPPPGWSCSRTAGHEGPCAASPVGEDAHGPSSASEPAGAPSQPRKYGFNRGQERDLELPSGGYIRFRHPTLSRLLDAGLGDLVDGFSADLLADMDEDQSREAVGRALLNPEKNTKILGPLNRIAALTVICPKVVLEGDTDDDQINADDIDIPDKMVIFWAAIGEQLEALKSLQQQQEAGVRDLPAGQGISDTPA